MVKFTVKVPALTAAELAEVLEALGAEVGGVVLDRIEVEAEF